MSKRARAFSLARELKHADSECYGEPVDVDALLVRAKVGDPQPQEVAQEAGEASQFNAEVELRPTTRG